MKQVAVLAAFVGIVACGRLDNTQYLPPNQGNQGGYQGNQGGYQGNQGGYQGNQGGYQGNQGNQGGYQGNQGSYSNQQQSSGPQVPILRLDNHNDGDGVYNFAYETGDGINAQEQGDARGDGTKAQGSFSYTAPDGQQIQISYSADENGFNPQGSHLPTPPPIPEEIQRAIEQNLADEARGIVDDGQYRAEHQGGGFDQGSAGNGQRGYSGATNQYVPPKAPQNGNSGGYKY